MWSILMGHGLGLLESSGVLWSDKQVGKARSQPRFHLSSGPVCVSVCLGQGMYFKQVSSLPFQKIKK